MNTNYNKLFFLTIIFTAITTNIAYSGQNTYDHNNSVVIKKSSNCMQKHHFSLPFLYNTFFGKLVRSALTKKWFSILAGCYCDLSLSKHHIPAFIEEHDVDISQAKKTVEEFSTFNDFFIRELKQEARPIDYNPATITSPSDGHILVFDNCSPIMQFPVKQSNFNLEEFLGNKELAELYTGGTLMIFRLSPYDYHRFHFPLDCTPSAPQVIHGIYESVNPIVYATGIQPLTQNERHITLLKTPYCNNVALVSVGALCVGKIKETYTPNVLHKKGSEAGYFCFGGSTIVLLFKKDTITVNDDIIRNSHDGIETPIHMGQKIAIMISY